MIRATADASASLAGRLARRAQLLALAHAERTLRARRHDPMRWRRAELVWPLFNRDI